MNIRDLKPPEGKERGWEVGVQSGFPRPSYWVAGWQLYYQEGWVLNEFERGDHAVVNAQGYSVPAVAWREPDGKVLWCSWAEEDK